VFAQRWSETSPRALTCGCLAGFDCGTRRAVLWLTAGVHFIQVAKWLGHSSYVLTLTTYADYIPEQETENPLPKPVAPVAVTADTSNVVPLRAAK
jgi:hypothetical protein